MEQSAFISNNGLSADHHFGTSFSSLEVIHSHRSMFILYGNAFLETLGVLWTKCWFSQGLRSPSIHLLLFNN